MNVAFRVGAEADFTSLFEIYALAMKEHIEAIWGWDAAWQLDEFRKHFDPAKIVVAADANRVIGYVQVEERPSEAYLRMLAIIPSYQRTGIGSRLLGRVVADAPYGASRIALQVFHRNGAALRFYERHGFRCVGETEVSRKMERTLPAEPALASDARKDARG